MPVFAFLIVCTTTLCSPAPSAPLRTGPMSAGPLVWEAPPTAEVVDAYLDLCFEGRDLDGAFGLISEDVHFVDPTAEVFGGPGARGVTGRDLFRTLSESWSLESSHFEIASSFVSGEYAVQVGSLDWKTAGQPPVTGVPFCTVLRVQEGVITERTDYGDYDDLVGTKRSPIEEAARSYFAAYAGLDLDGLEKRLAENAVLEDPIGASTGGVGRIEGQTHSLASLEEAQAFVRDLDLEVAHSFFSGTHAFFYGTARYRVVLEGKEARLEHPFAHLIQFEGEKVILHRRYVDHESIQRRLSSVLSKDARDAGAAKSEG